MTNDLESVMHALLQALVGVFRQPAVHTVLSPLVANCPVVLDVSPPCPEPISERDLCAATKLSQYRCGRRTMRSRHRCAHVSGRQDGGTLVMAAANTRTLDRASVEQSTALLTNGPTR